MRIRTATSFITLLLWATAVAGETGLLAGARLWRGDTDGSVRYPSADPSNDIDLNRDLGYDGIEAGNYYLRFEHPVPLLPNAMLSRTELDENARGRLSRTVDFGGSSFIVGEDIDSQVEYRQSDIILYYNIIDTVANLEIGLDARHIDSATTLNGSSGARETAQVTGWIPLLYAGVGFDLPLTGLSVGADGSFLGYRGHHFYDVTLRASYTSPLRLGADLGYRHLKLELDDFEDYSADLEFSGPYAGVFVDF